VAKVALFDTSTNLVKDLRVDAPLLNVLDDSFYDLYSAYRFTTTTFEEVEGSGCLMWQDTRLLSLGLRTWTILMNQIAYSPR
jgi:hypothetical protein